MPKGIKTWFKISPKSLILFTIFLDVLGVGLIIPILPYYVEVFNLPDIVVSSLFATFSLFAFFSAPIMGMISDRKGRRPVLILSLFSTALGWFIFAFSKNIFGLFLGRIVDGLAAGNISTAQNYLIDISEDRKDQIKNLGLMGAVSGIGFISGPVVGGVLFAIEKKLPFIVVGAVSLFSTILAYFMLPETNHKKNKKEFSFNPFRPIIKGFQNKKLVPLYMAWFLLTATVAINQSVLALYISKMFSWTVIAAGVIVTVLGLIFAFNQTILLQKIWIKYFKEKSLVVWNLLPFALGYLVMAFPFRFSFLIGLIVSAFCYSTLRVLINKHILDYTKPDEQGEMMGVLASLLALAMFTGPVLGGSTYELAPNMPFIVAGGIVAFTFLLINRAYKIA